jgi:hypothetical protein
MNTLGKQVDNPEVTLDIESHLIPTDVRDAGFLDWLLSAVVVGDDGKRYWFGTSPLIMDLEKLDFLSIECSWETGEVVPFPGTIYKLADFPEVGKVGKYPNPAGTLQVERSEKQVRVTVGDNYEITIKDDKTWHYKINDPVQDIQIDVIHYGKGFPTWYGKEKPSYLTPHSIAYGYNWSGVVEGKLTIDGREINIKGAGIRERYIAVDSSAAEIGGWEDWMWFHFDEVYGSMYEMKLGNKDMSLNILYGEGIQYFSEGSFEIEHQEWAYLRALGAFIPTVYKIKMQVLLGTLEFTAKAVGATVWGVTNIGPSTPVATLNWDKLEGVFTYNDGTKQVLTNGFGGTSIRQIKPYPSIFAPELSFDDPLLNGKRYTTL